MIVTKEKLVEMLTKEDKRYVKLVIGKALVVLYNNQTESEKMSATTQKDNGIGFTGFDANSGTFDAQTFLKNGSLTDFQMNRWLKKDKNGNMRLVKYWRQLNEAAEQKARRTGS